MPVALVVILLLIMPHEAGAQGTCRLEGVWQLVSGSHDGRAYPASYRSMKVITKRHFVVVGDEERGVKQLTTAADSLRAYRTMVSGGGTYTLAGDTYTEKYEYLSNPANVGTSLSFSCRTEGDRFHLTAKLPVRENGRKVRDVTVAEVWRRVE